MSALTLYQLVALMLLCIGLYGIVFRRSLVGMLICVELMLNGAGLSIVAAAQLTPCGQPRLVSWPLFLGHRGLRLPRQHWCWPSSSLWLNGSSTLKATSYRHSRGRA